MPIFYSNGTNKAVGLQQLYRKRSLKPAGRCVIEGMCMGLSITWIRRMLLGWHFSYVPHEIEAMINQQFYTYGISPALANAWPESDSSDEHEEQEEVAHNRQPGDYAQDRDFIELLSLHGMEGVYRGEIGPNDVFLLIAEVLYNDDAVKTYLLSAKLHMFALAIRDRNIAIFDSNTGTTVFSVRDSFDETRLLAHLASLVSDCTNKAFGVMEVRY
jgi:hypothetical protein